MHLQHHITHLLKSHNCVIVPGFGGFIGNYEPANADYTTHFFFPPAKRVLFNSSLIQGDGLLANELMRVEGFSYSEALERIAVFVTTCKTTLASGGRIDFEEIGFLFAQNGKVVFEQNRENNLLLDSYGLKQIPFVDFSIKTITRVHVPVNTSSKPKEKEPVLEKVVQQQPAKTEEALIIALDTGSEIEEIDQPVDTAANDGKVIAINHRKKAANENVNRNNRYKYLAAAVVLPVLFYSYWIPMKTDALSTGKIQLGDFNPLRSQSGQLYDPRTSGFVYEPGEKSKAWDELTGSLPPNVLVYNYELDEETYIPVLLERESSSTQTNTGDMFHLIANCFSVKRNAEKYVDELNRLGYKASIVGEHNGLHRVSAGAYASAQEAEAALSIFKNSGNSGWILEP